MTKTDQTVGHCLKASSLNSPLVVRMTGLLVVVMNVLMAARNPESSSKITSTSSNRMREVAVFLLCSSLLFSLEEVAAGDLTAGSLGLLVDSLAFTVFLEAATRGDEMKRLIKLLKPGKKITFTKG